MNPPKFKKDDIVRVVQEDWFQNYAPHIRAGEIYIVEDEKYYPYSIKVYGIGNLEGPASYFPESDFEKFDGKLTELEKIIYGVKDTV